MDEKLRQESEFKTAENFKIWVRKGDRTIV